MAVSNVELRVTATGAIKELRRTDTQAKKLNTSFDETKRKAASATANIQRFGIAFRSVLGPVVALTGAVTFLNKSLSVFADRQADANLLAAGLKKIGAATGDLEKLQKVASDLGDQTLFNQEDFTQGFALLTSFKAIGQDSFERVATAAADMAATTKQDVNSSLLQLAKALENPVEGMSALSRSGTTFTQVQKDIVKGLVESNKTLEAQNYILNLVEEQYKGNARAAAIGLAGAQDTLSESIRDFNEVVGQISLEPAIAATNALTELFKLATNELNEWNKSFNKLSQLLAPVTGGLDLVGQAIQNTTEALKLGIPGLSATLQMYEKIIAVRALLNAQGELPGTSQDLRPEQGAALDPEAVARFQRQLQLEDAFKVAKTPGGAKGAKGAAAKERVDMSQELFDLNKRLLDQSDALTESERIVLNFQIEKQKIAEENLGPRAEEIKLLKAAAGFEQDILDRREEQQKLTDKANKKAAEETKRQEEAAKRRLEADPGFQMQQQLEKLLETQNQVAFAATSMGSAFANAFGDVVTGAKTGQEALADMLKSIASDFLAMAKKIIAQQLAMILYGTIMKALGIGGGGGSSSDPFGTGLSSVSQIGGGGMVSPFAEGGYVNKPTNALIGEGGEPEYVIPASKMRESMSRYSNGSRGNSVIPANGGGGGAEMEGDGGGVAVAAPIDVRYTVERINDVNYVTADQFQNGMRSAAEQGAKRGEQNTLKRLQMSGSTRKRLGL